jgi:hypothetical protein
MALTRQPKRVDFMPGHQNIQSLRHGDALMAGYHNIHMQTRPNTRIPQLRMLEYQLSPVICATCCNLNSRKFSMVAHQSTLANQIEIYLTHILAASTLGCPFCGLLLQVFRKFVPTAEVYLSRIPRNTWGVPPKPSDARIRLIIEEDQPICVNIIDGLDPKAPALAQLLCYNPSGNSAHILQGVQLC